MKLSLVRVLPLAFALLVPSVAFAEDQGAAPSKPVAAEEGAAAAGKHNAHTAKRAKAAKPHKAAPKSKATKAPKAAKKAPKASKKVANK